MISDTFTKKHVFNSRSINYNIKYFGKSVSKIKYSIKKEILSIVLEGMKTISIFDKNKPNKSVKFSIIKNTGLVISQNTVISENTNKKSIILTIINE